MKAIILRSVVLFGALVALSASVPSQAPARQGLKVLISVVMEGVAGVVTVTAKGQLYLRTRAS